VLERGVGNAEKDIGRPRVIQVVPSALMGTVPLAVREVHLSAHNALKILRWVHHFARAIPVQQAPYPLLDLHHVFQTNIRSQPKALMIWQLRGPTQILLGLRVKRRGVKHPVQYLARDMVKDFQSARQVLMVLVIQMVESIVAGVFRVRGQLLVHQSVHYVHMAITLLLTLQIYHSVNRVRVENIL
jgi:hypothetical protein